MRSLVITACMIALSSAGRLCAEEAAPRPFNRPAMDPQLRANMIKTFDKDGDGKLNEEELKAMLAARRGEMEKMRQAQEKAFDKDGDGKLNDEERKAMQEARHGEMEKMRQAQEKAFDKDGDGKLNDEERKAMMASFQRHQAPGEGGGDRMKQLMAKFDKDGDGKLNDEERKAMREARIQEAQRRQGATATNAVPSI